MVSLVLLINVLFSKARFFNSKFLFWQVYPRRRYPGVVRHSKPIWHVIVWLWSQTEAVRLQLNVTNCVPSSAKFQYSRSDANFNSDVKRFSNNTDMKIHCRSSSSLPNPSKFSQFISFKNLVYDERSIMMLTKRFTNQNSFNEIWDNRAGDLLAKGDRS